MEEVSAVVNCFPTPQPVHPDIRATDMNLKLTNNIIYLVAGVVIQDGKVLLIQECKISFKNKWYLPAGRMERGESIVEAVKREVLEESGFEFEPEALIAVQRMDRKRVRFGLAGKIVGGSIKTKEQADAESIQAGWFTTDTSQLVNELKLRNESIVPLIEVATQWFAHRPYTGLPVAVGHVSSSQRVVLVHDDGQELRVLLSRGGGTSRLPACLICRDTLFTRVDYRDALDSVVKACGYRGKYRNCGVLSMEHSGEAFDGFCLTCVLVATDTELTQDSMFDWSAVSDPDCVTRLRTAIREDIRGCALFT